MGGVVNECVPLYAPGVDITCQATAAITGKRFVAPSGNRTSGPGLATTGEGSNYRVAHAAAAAAVLGVSKYDAASGAKVGVVTGGVVPVTAGGSIAAGARVEVGANGQVVTLASGVPVGIAMTGATSGNDAEIRLF